MNLKPKITQKWLPSFSEISQKICWLFNFHFCHLFWCWIKSAFWKVKMIVTWGGAVWQLLSKLSLRSDGIRFYFGDTKSTRKSISWHIFICGRLILFIRSNLAQNGITVTSCSDNTPYPIKICVHSSIDTRETFSATTRSPWYYSC